MNRRFYLLWLAILFITLLMSYWTLRHNKAPFKNCSQANARGVYDIMIGTKAYDPKLDRDHDGKACE